MNIKESEIATIDTAIADKTDIFSVTTADVADRLKEIVDLLGAILVNPSLTYNTGLIVYTASPFSVYVCKVDGADGDVTNQTNWLKIAGAGLPYLVADTEVDVAVVGYQVSSYYVAFPINLSLKAGTFFDLRIEDTSNNTNTVQVAYGITIDTAGSIEGTSIIIKLDNNGVGMATLLVDGTYSERLAFGSTYLFTKTTDANDLDGYILTKIGSSGIKICNIGDYNPNPTSPGKYIITANSAMNLPLAAGLAGEECIFIRSAAGIANTPVTSGGDTVVNTDGLLYNRSLMRFTSDGINKWYYTV
jgi:hypothetical protein